jgi:hypothetical protein
MPPLLPACIVLLGLSTAAPHITPAELSPFLRVISAGAGAPGRIACKDIDEAMQMKKDGLSPDAKAPVAWAANLAQIKAYLAEGKLVVSGDPADFKEGVGIVITREHGKPEVIIDTKNAAASGVPLSDTLMKIAKHI